MSAKELGAVTTALETYKDLLEGKTPDRHRDWNRMRTAYDIFARGRDHPDVKSGTLPKHDLILQAWERCRAVFQRWDEDEFVRHWEALHKPNVSEPDAREAVKYFAKDYFAKEYVRSGDEANRHTWLVYHLDAIMDLAESLEVLGGGGPDNPNLDAEVPPGLPTWKRLRRTLRFGEYVTTEQLFASYNEVLMARARPDLRGAVDWQRAAAESLRWGKGTLMRSPKGREYMFMLETIYDRESSLADLMEALATMRQTMGEYYKRKVKGEGWTALRRDITQMNVVAETHEAWQEAGGRFASAQELTKSRLEAGEKLSLRGLTSRRTSWNSFLERAQSDTLAPLAYRYFRESETFFAREGLPVESYESFLQAELSRQRLEQVEERAGGPKGTSRYADAVDVLVGWKPDQDYAAVRRALFYIRADHKSRRRLKGEEKLEGDEGPWLYAWLRNKIYGNPDVIIDQRDKLLEEDKRFNEFLIRHPNRLDLPGAVARDFDALFDEFMARKPEDDLF